jgi:hypothetical protein
MITQCIISMDPAKLRDWCSICVLDMYPSGENKRFEYNLIAMNRKQGLPYDHPEKPSVASWALEVWKNPAFWGNKQPPIFILDSTGVGVAVTDIMKAKGMSPKAIMITAGNAITREGSTIHVSKARMIGKFIGAFDAGKVHINPGMAIWPKVQRELLAFRAELTAQGNARFEAEEGENDDMVMALAQGVWYGEEILKGARAI